MLCRARDGLDARSRGRSCPASQAQLTPSAIRAFRYHYTRMGYIGRRRRGRLSQRPAQVLEADDLADRAGHLAPAGLSIVLGGACRVHHAVVQVAGEQPTATSCSARVTEATWTTT